MYLYDFSRTVSFLVQLDYVAYVSVFCWFPPLSSIPEYNDCRESLKYQYQYQYPCLKYKYTSNSTSVPSTSTSTTDQVPVQVPSTTTLVVNVLYLGFCEICRVAERGASDQRASTLRPSVWRNPADHRRSVTGHIHCHGGLHRSPSRLHRYTAVSIRIIDTSLVGGVA